MAKILTSTCCTVCFLFSVLVNIFSVTYFYTGGTKWKNDQLSWSQAAAAEAELVASLACSGHGRAYLDGLVVSGQPVCECNTCYQGPDCSEFIADCPADADSGDPLFLEPYWMKNAASSAVVVTGWHRMSYTFPDHTTISQELEKHIRRVHAIAKNAITDGRYVVFGAGSTQLLIAAVFALSLENSSFPARVFASVPYYPLYKLQTDYFKTVHFEFDGDTSLLENNSDATNVIEFVTSPNNPDGQLKKAILQGPSVRTIYDHAYYWPHFSAIPAPVDEGCHDLYDIQAHRPCWKWAIIKDKDVYQKMLTYMSLAEMGTSRDTQLRALKLLKTIIKDDGREIFDFGYKSMRNRWEKLSQVMSLSKRFSLQELSPQYCNFLNKIKEPSPAYAWLKCEREEDTDCTAVLRAGNIIGREGSTYNVENRYVRLSLLKSQDDFEWLLHRMKELVAKESGAQVI